MRKLFIPILSSDDEGKYTAKIINAFFMQFRESSHNVYLRSTHVIPNSLDTHANKNETLTLAMLMAMLYTLRRFLCPTCVRYNNATFNIR